MKQAEVQQERGRVPARICAGLIGSHTWDSAVTIEFGVDHEKWRKKELLPFRYKDFRSFGQKVARADQMHAVLVNEQP